MRISSKVRRLAEISRPSEALLAARILFVALMVPVVMRLPLPRLRALLEPRQVVTSYDPALERRVLDRIDLVLDVFSSVLRPTCLTRGVTRYFFLRRAGANIGLAFGIGQPNPPAYAGHCWLVRDGQPILERRDPRSVFTETYRIS